MHFKGTWPSREEEEEVAGGETESRRAPNSSDLPCYINLSLD